jgi:hypothetical protein
MLCCAAAPSHLPSAPLSHCISHILVGVGGSNENGRKNHISTFVSIFFGGNGIGFGKYGFGNGIGICGCTETNKYGCRAKKLS